MLSESQREEAFPVHIDLGKKVAGRVSYPVVDFGDTKVSEQLPDEGCALVHFKKSEDGSIEAHRICLSDEGGEGDYGPKTLESVMDGKMDAEETDDDDGEE